MKLLKLQVSLILLAIMPGILSGQMRPQMPKIAILNFAVRGNLGKAQADRFIDMLRRESAKAAGWSVLSLEEMAVSLQDSNADAFRVADLKQARKIGKKLQASRVIFGLMAQQDSLCGIRLFIHDLKKNEARTGLTKSFATGDSANMQAIAEIIASLDIGPNRKIQPNDSTGVLVLTTVPDSGTVFLNDEMIGCTPLRIGYLKPGEYALLVTKPPCKPTRGVVTIQNGQMREYHTVLHREITVLVESTPAGAQIYINDAPIGVAPRRVKLTSETVYNFRFTLEGYSEVFKKISFSQDKMLSVNFNDDRKKWYYWGGGSAATIGVLYYLTSRNSRSRSKAGEGLPVPPGRP